MLLKVSRIYEILNNKNIENVLITYGNLYFAKGSMDKAKLFYLKANKLKPKNTKALNELAKVYFFEKKINKSIQTLEAILEINPKDKNAIANLKHLKPEFRLRKRNEKTKVLKDLK